MVRARDGACPRAVDDKGSPVLEAGPSTPVEPLGMNGVPEPSDKIYVVKDEKDARQIVSHLEDKTAPSDWRRSARRCSR